LTAPSKLPKLALDQFAPKIQAALEAREEAKKLLAFADAIEQEIKDFIGDRDVEATVFGVPVYTYQRKAAYAWRQFQNDNPHIAERFMVEKVVKELDKNAVLKNFGDVLANYQTREFRHINRKAA